MPGGARPSGLGWLEDGAMVVVNMDNKLLQYKDGKVSVHADLSAFKDSTINGTLKHVGRVSKTSLTSLPIPDMVVSSTGIAYVGTTGFDLDGTARAKGWPWVHQHATDKELLGKIIAVDKVSLSSSSCSNS